MKRGITTFLILGVLLCVDAYPYDPFTHRDLSVAATESSVLRRDLTVLTNLGLEPLSEEQAFSINGFDRKTIVQHIRDGSRVEDNGFRVVNHFFDPLHDRGLFGSNHRSPDWALEDKSDIDDQISSLKDARRNFYLALTASAADERERRFGLTFEKLGQVIHHLQDMAQPQHTRNDDHLDFPFIEIPGLENPSRYERHTRLVQSARVFTELLLPGLYPNVVFPSARNFWHTNEKNPVAGRGVAEFSNSNFVSQSTNFDTIRYPFPRFEDATPWDDNANQLLESVGHEAPPECLPPNQTCSMTFFRAPVTDNFRPTLSGINDRASTLSIFDQDLKANNTTYSFTNLDNGQVFTTNHAFSLNRFNFDEAHKFLIPRAVAYSAGLIDYFFRGRLEAEDVEFTDTGIRLRVKNAIDPQEVPAWKDEILHARTSSGSAGTFVVAYEYRDASGATRYGASPPVTATGGDLAPGQTSLNSYNFTVSVPVDANDVKYRLVFRGRLGQEEDAVALGVVEPTSGFLVSAGYVPADGVRSPRLIERSGGEWKLSDKAGLVAGNIDWKGWYVNGKPTRVLSWVGPTTRYFPKGYHPNLPGYFSPASTAIFQSGNVLAVAPRAVLGAALMKDSAGKEWLIAIGREGMADVVYRRRIDIPDFFREIKRFTHDSTVLNPANIPWFFNSSGTEAQTMRSGHKAGDSRLHLFRLKITIDDNSVEFSNEGNLGGIDLGGLTKTTECDDNDSNTGCGSGCSGSGEERHERTTTVTLQRIGGGSYIVAVDYVQDEPVFATYSETITSVSTHRISLNFFRRYICRVRFLGACGNDTSHLESRGETTLEDAREIVKKISIPGFNDIILESMTGPVRSRISTTQINSTVTTDRAGESHLRAVIAKVRYLDLRHGLYSIYSDIIDLSGQTTAVSSITGFPNHRFDVPVKRKIEQSIGFFNSVHAVNEAMAAETQQRISTGGTLLSPGVCNTTQTNPGAIVPVLITDSGSDFSGAVDSNGNVFVSEAKLDASIPAKKVGDFHFLTGGDPREIIPLAPADAVYGNIRVVK